jgi:flavin-dependent dehydrogenase
MRDPIRQVTIVGGGTAGWLTALILRAYLNKNINQGRIAITVIESPKVPTIGVGESTIQNLKATLQLIGINEAEFIRRSNASFKTAVRFIDWSRPEGEASPHWYNPQNGPPPCGGFLPAYHYRKFGPHWLGASYGESVLPNASLIVAGKGPRQIYAPDYSYDINYSYHVDAGLFADFMREFALARGVEHVRDDVVDVLLDETGAIAALQLEQRGRYPVEFVIDCTGFKALIWSRMGAEPFIPVNDRLLNDRAIPLQIPHPDPTKIEPCTRATALDAGWAWRVPLYSRLGTGYVYSSAFRSDEEAHAEFLRHLRATGDLPADVPDPQMRVIKMRTGYTRQPWIKNCVAIGLSSGFVEPLEATAIYAIDAAAHRLTQNFPNKDCNPALAKAYNACSTALMEEIVDYLQINYITSNRKEPYWVAVREQTRRSEWLQDKMELWRVRFPDFDDSYEKRLFSYFQYTYVLLSSGYLANVRFPLEHAIRIEDWQAFGRDLKAQAAKLSATLPSHYDLLTNIREQRSAPALNLGQPPFAAAGRSSARGLVP